MTEQFYEMNFRTLANYHVCLVITDDILESRRQRADKLGKYMYDDSNLDGLHSYNPDDPRESWIFLESDVLAGTVAHESYHCIRHVFNTIGAGYPYDNELFAYHLGYLVEWITEQLSSCA